MSTASKAIFVTGGARSGKSLFAEKRALEFGAPLGYLATAQSFDAEMDQRITRHQLRRGDAWTTIEEPLNLAQALSEQDGRFSAILVDCLTLWLTNLLLQHGEPGEEAVRQVMAEVNRLADTVAAMTTPVIIVSNEVGMGIVPENRLARVFRDVAGEANQITALTADEAWLVASGLPLRLK